MAEATYEAKPRRSVIERVVSGMSEHGVTFKEGSGGSEYTPADYAAALGNIDDPLVSGLFWGGYMGYRKARTSLINRLHLWGWHRWAIRDRAGKIDVLLHGRLAALAVYEQIERRPTYDEILKSLGVGAERWRLLRPHYADLQGRIAQAESDLSRHLNERLKEAS